MARGNQPPGPWDPRPSEAAPGAPMCTQCGAPAATGLAACPFCDVAYPGVPAGARCPGCRKLNVSRRTACASCGHDMTRACSHCQHASPLELVACWHCHRPFPCEHSAESGPRPGATTTDDPCHVLSALDEILKS